MGKNFGRTRVSGKNVVVLGLAKSGFAVSKLLSQLGARVTVNDQKAEHDENAINELKELGVQVIVGGHPSGLIHQGIDLIVKNPGIPYTAEPVLEGTQLGIPIITEVELAYQITKAPIVGITGSNGKTTTTTWVGEILQAANRQPIVAGNIGTVFCEKANTARPDEILVAELSSFQLKGTKEFRPNVACLLNISSAHLDYHKTMEDYVLSKSKLFANMQKDDIAVLNADNEYCIKMVEVTQAQIMWFSAKQPVSIGAFVRDADVVFLDQFGNEEKIIAVSEIGIPGAHNLENALAATVISKSLGVDCAVIRQVLAGFKGVEHRLEFVEELNGIKYYNDSKATNAQATMKALASFTDPIILIAGGLDRGVDFEELVPLLKEKVKGLVTYGQTKERFERIGKLAGLNLLDSVDNVRDAVVRASQMASVGNIVLLSPACASWDMYSSFEERGSIFKESVHMLKTSPH
ncbi:MAG TPA: UDP-N-acetylmuramoyl-L-alanine--D-glutamate ligase [Bacillota bacterium]|nr:UDP-N-acetylmuramoyl-L-alanine--D-glutamate ligase [Bacillota bacterium]